MNPANWLALVAAWVKWKPAPGETKPPAVETKPAIPETVAGASETAVRTPRMLPMPCVVRTVGEHHVDFMGLN